MLLSYSSSFPFRSPLSKCSLTILILPLSHLSILGQSLVINLLNFNSSLASWLISTGKLKAMGLRESQTTTPLAIPDLPTELIAIICREADYETQKSLRLVSKAFNGLTEPELFRTLHLKVTKDSWRKFQHISLSLELREYARAIVYDTQLVQWGIASLDVWTSIARDVDYDPRVQHLSMDDESDYEILQEYFEEYLEKLEDQKDFHHGDTEVDFLRETVARFPGLVSIECVLHPKSLDMRPPGPEDARFHAKRISAIMQACGETGRKISSLTAGWFDVGHLARKFVMPMSSAHQLCLEGLSHLSLHMVDRGGPQYNPDIEMPPCRAIDLIDAARNLRSLDIEGGRWIIDKPDDFMISNVNALCDLELPNLTKLRLASCMRFHEDSLKTFLGKHAVPLKQLALSDLTIYRFDAPTQGVLSRPTFSFGDKDLDCGSWARVFEYMSRELDLVHLDLYGIFSNYWNEAWLIAKTADEYEDISWENSAKRRIVHYILHGGESPFKTNVGSERYHTLSHGLVVDISRYIEDEDVSWSIALDYLANRYCDVDASTVS